MQLQLATFDSLNTFDPSSLTYLPYCSLLYVASLAPSPQVGEFLEEQCTNPTFICDHPQLMSPLAKWWVGG